MVRKNPIDRVAIAGTKLKDATRTLRGRFPDREEIEFLARDLRGACRAAAGPLVDIEALELEQDLLRPENFADTGRIEENLQLIGQRYYDALVRENSAERVSGVRGALQRAGAHLAAAANELEALSPDAHRLVLALYEADRDAGRDFKSKPLPKRMLVPDRWWQRPDMGPLDTPFAQLLKGWGRQLSRLADTARDSGGKTNVTNSQFAPARWQLINDTWRLLACLGVPAEAGPQRLMAQSLNYVHTWVTGDSNEVDFDYRVRPYLKVRAKHAALLARARSEFAKLQPWERNYLGWLHSMISTASLPSPPRRPKPELWLQIAEILEELRLGPSGSRTSETTPSK